MEVSLNITLNDKNLSFVTADIYQKVEFVKVMVVTVLSILKK